MPTNWILGRKPQQLQQT